jgi:hypothetical protein
MLLDATLELVDLNILNETMPVDAHEHELKQIVSELIHGEPRLAARFSKGSELLARTNHSFGTLKCNRQVIVKPLGLNLEEFSGLPQSMVDTLGVQLYLDFSFYGASRINAKYFRPTQLVMRLHLGSDARYRAIDLILDHNYFVDKILRQSKKLKFHECVGFDNLQRLPRKAGMVETLLTYIKNDDPERHCWLEASFGRSDSAEDILAAFKSLGTFYDLVLGYQHPKRKSKVRILDYID